jgi:hypothetical protein
MLNSIRSGWTGDDKRPIADGLFFSRHMRQCNVSGSGFAILPIEDSLTFLPLIRLQYQVCKI